MDHQITANHKLNPTGVQFQSLPPTPAFVRNGRSHRFLSEAVFIQRDCDLVTSIFRGSYVLIGPTAEGTSSKRERRERAVATGWDLGARLGAGKFKKFLVAILKRKSRRRHSRSLLII